MPEQLGACETLASGAPCTIGSDGFGERAGRVCVPPVCGDGIRTGREECDGDDLAGVDDCTDVDFYQPGPVACGSDCRFDTRACSERCGDHILNGPELCEPNVSTPNETCVDFGYDAGALGCSLFCTPRFTDCKRIGWHRISTTGTVWRGAWTAPDGTVFGVGSGSVLEVSGTSVTPTSLPSTAALRLRQLNGVWGTSTSDVFAVGEDGVWWHRDAGGWSVVHSDPDVAFQYDLYGLWGASATNVFAVG